MEVKSGVGGDPRLLTLAVAGIAGPVLFTALVIGQGLIQLDYSHVALPISALAAWPLGWLQNLNFFISGVLMTAFAIGLHLGVRPGPTGVIGPALLVVNGLGILVAGAFPWRNVNGVLIEPAGHILGAVMAFLGIGSGLTVMSRRLAGDPKWHNMAAYTLASGIAVLVLFVVFAGFAISPGAPLYPWAGAVQRAVVGVWFACTIALALRLLRVARNYS